MNTEKTYGEVELIGNRIRAEHYYPQLQEQSGGRRRLLLYLCSKAMKLTISEISRMSEEEVSAAVEKEMSSWKGRGYKDETLQKS